MPLAAALPALARRCRPGAVRERLAGRHQGREARRLVQGREGDEPLQGVQVRRVHVLQGTAETVGQGRRDGDGRAQGGASTAQGRRRAPAAALPQSMHQRARSRCRRFEPRCRRRPSRCAAAARRAPRRSRCGCRGAQARLGCRTPSTRTRRSRWPARCAPPPARPRASARSHAADRATATRPLADLQQLERQRAVHGADVRVLHESYAPPLRPRPRLQAEVLRVQCRSPRQAVRVCEAPRRESALDSRLRPAVHAAARRDDVGRRVERDRRHVPRARRHRREGHLLAPPLVARPRAVEGGAGRLPRVVRRLERRAEERARVPRRAEAARRRARRGARRARCARPSSPRSTARAVCAQARRTPVFFLWYEDLLRDPEPTFDALQRFLGVEPRRLKTRAQRIVSDGEDSSKWISNLKEVKAAAAAAAEADAREGGGNVRGKVD